MTPPDHNQPPHPQHNPQRNRSRAYEEPRAVAIRVVRTLREAGHVAYLAGGCVRDELLGIEPKDYDVATSATPESVQQLFDRTSAVGASFGVVLVRERKVTIEVATFRNDGVYSDARRPDAVEFSTPEEDARRRDFTINALFLDPLEADESARVIDFVGGRADLKAGVIRAVGDPEARLAEDHLRALRAVRFACRYEFEIEAGTRDAIRAHASSLRGVSRERIGDEVRRMMAHPSRARAARTLAELDLAGAIFERAGDPGLATLEALTRAETGAGTGVDTGAKWGADAPAPVPVPTVLAAWAVDRRGQDVFGEGRAGEVASEWRRALMLSNDETASLRGAIECAGAFLHAWDGLGVAARKRLASGTHGGEGLRLLAAIDSQRWTRVRDEIALLDADGVGLAPPPIVTGETLINAGYRPGRGFSVLLDLIYDAQLEGRVRDEQRALEFAAEQAKQAGVERA